MKVQMKIYFPYRKFKLAGNKNNTSSMSSIICISTMNYLTDEMNTMCILYDQTEENDFRSFKYIWTS